MNFYFLKRGGQVMVCSLEFTIAASQEPFFPSKVTFALAWVTSFLFYELNIFPVKLIMEKEIKFNIKGRWYAIQNFFSSIMMEWFKKYTEHENYCLTIYKKNCSHPHWILPFMKKVYIYRIMEIRQHHT